MIGRKGIGWKIGRGRLRNVYGIGGKKMRGGEKEYGGGMMEIEKEGEEY